MSHSLNPDTCRSYSASRFWSRVDSSGGPDACWPWQGELNDNGYGRLRFGGKMEVAHRVAYELTHGAIPAVRFVCHSCDNPPCCNPAHLWVGTAIDNLRDCVADER